MRLLQKLGKYLQITLQVTHNSENGYQVLCFLCNSSLEIFTLTLFFPESKRHFILPEIILIIIKTKVTFAENLCQTLRQNFCALFHLIITANL